VVAGGAAVAAACGLASNGTGENVVDRPETSTPIDATTDDAGFVDTDGGFQPDASFDAATIDAELDADAGSLPIIGCDSVDSGGVTSCSDCAGKPTACAATNSCVTDCATDCAGARIACFRCFGGGATVVGTCEKENDAGYCMGGVYTPGAACPCMNKDASACPGDNQICIDGGAGVFGCRSCGEPGTKDQICKGGSGAQKCDFMGNAADHLTCH
jgi:hypothetical protein